MNLILKNNSADSFSYLSGTIVVPAEGSLNVDSSYWFQLLGDLIFIKDIRENNLVVNDGVSDFVYPNSETYLRQLVTTDNYANRDTDGALITRIKAAKKGWSFLALPPEITTSTIGGTLFCKDSLGNDIPGFTCKIYDANGVEITDPGLANVNLSSCVKTVLDFEAAYDYELIGGSLRINSNPAQDLRLWIVGAPDIPAAMGGSKEFASGVNLKFLAPNSSFDIDGRVTKYIKYDPTTHQGKLRLVLKHAAGSQVNMQFVINLYRL